MTEHSLFLTFPSIGPAKYALHHLQEGNHILNSEIGISANLEQSGGIHVNCFVDYADRCRGIDTADLRISAQLVDGELTVQGFDSSYHLTAVLVHCRIADRSGFVQDCVFAGVMPTGYLPALRSGVYLISGLQGWQPPVLSDADQQAAIEEQEFLGQPPEGLRHAA